MKQDPEDDYVELAPLAVATIVTDEELAASPFGKQVFVEVIAPATLPGGYQFIVSVENQSYLVSVPAAGVTEGQKFQPTILEKEERSVYFPPVGSWKSDLFGCADHGGSIENVTACLCLPIAIGQLLERLHLDALGREKGTVAAAANAYHGSSTHLDRWNAFRNWQRIAVVWFILRFLLDVKFPFIVLFTVALLGLRYKVQQRYALPRYPWWQEVLISLLCSCCSLTQMMRHTADYSAHPASYCSPTGQTLPPNHPGLPLVGKMRQRLVITDPTEV